MSFPVRGGRRDLPQTGPGDQPGSRGNRPGLLQQVDHREPEGRGSRCHIVELRRGVDDNPGSTAHLDPDPLSPHVERDPRAVQGRTARWASSAFSP